MSSPGLDSGEQQLATRKYAKGQTVPLGYQGGGPVGWIFPRNLVSQRSRILNCGRANQSLLLLWNLLIPQPGDQHARQVVDQGAEAESSSSWSLSLGPPLCCHEAAGWKRGPSSSPDEENWGSLTCSAPTQPPGIPPLLG